MPSFQRVNQFIYPIIVLSLACFICTLNYKDNDLSSLISTLLIVFIYFLIYCIFTNYTYLINAIKLVIVIMMFIIILKFNKDNIPTILQKYKTLIVCVAIISLFFWLFGSVLGILKPTSYVLSSWGVNGYDLTSVPSYYGLYFETQNINSSISFLNNICRNTAIFTEAPMASLNFSLALGITSFEKNNKLKKVKECLLVLAILSTFSTTGYIFIVLFFIGNFLIKDKRKFMNNYKLIFLIILLIVGLLVIILLLNEKLNFDTNSSSVRIDDYIVGLKVWSQYPIFGVGIENHVFLKQMMSSWRSINTGFSNSPMDILTGGGIYLFLGYMYCFVRAIYYYIKYKEWKKLLFAILLIYLFILTIFTYTYILLFILVWFGYSNRKLREEII